MESLAGTARLGRFGLPPCSSASLRHSDSGLYAAKDMAESPLSFCKFGLPPSSSSLWNPLVVLVPMEYMSGVNPPSPLAFGLTPPATSAFMRSRSPFFAASASSATFESSKYIFTGYVSSDGSSPVESTAWSAGSVFLPDSYRQASRIHESQIQTQSKNISLSFHDNFSCD